MTAQKRDARQIRRFMSELKRSLAGTAKVWWPDCLFHFTDIRNAASILRAGAVYSRNEAERRGLMATDSASGQIIGNTSDEWKDQVRLYFRPKTPTQYRNEGFVPAHMRYYGAHCPVPVYFIFDANAVLSRADSRFSDGNLASSGSKTFSTAAELSGLPFGEIYHNDPIPLDEPAKGSIIFHRQAEVIVPDWLSLDALRGVVCRSRGEYETLMHILPPQALARWGHIPIRVADRMDLFNKQWPFVESVDLDSRRVVFNFNLPVNRPGGPFHAESIVTDTLSNLRHTWESGSYTFQNELSLDLESVGPFEDYSVRLLLDGHLAYADRYQGDGLPW